MTKPAILFRFHKAFDVCAQNLRLLRCMNPDVPIYGLYGGFGGVEAVPKLCTNLLDSLHALPYEDAHYNWMHGDICIRWWHKEHGHTHNFTHLCVVEWDWVHLKPLMQAYSGFMKQGNYIALSGSYQTLYDEGWTWISEVFEWSVKQLVKDTGVDPTALSYGIFGGCALSRSFLDQYIERPISSHCNDEVRLSIYSKFFNEPINDAGFLSDKRNIVCASGSEYGLSEIKKAIEQGGSAVYPIRILIPELEKIIDRQINA